ncbi:hypothetical protein G210_1150 [Candida maltosa Xu316]|uniref:Uncharacterized protein n=1 Tax=Candida maltosa (strain Xu316) TaxID=1245528 RepID=M3K0S6_CANMX|nr:hypothetical protein G210_1150 [Candida maltosa Xu316]
MQYNAVHCYVVAISIEFGVLSNEKVRTCSLKLSRYG